MAHYRTNRWADERNGPPPPYINCVAASGVNIGRAATNGAIQPTDAEVIALRTATGDVSGGEGLMDLAKGMKSRYTITTKPVASWRAIETGLGGKTWFVAVFDYIALPARLRNPGQGSVFHAAAFGPSTDHSAVLVDSLEFPTVVARSILFSELEDVLNTGGYAALGVDEFSYTPHVAVGGSDTRTMFFYTLHANGTWTRRSVLTGGFSGLCTPAPDPAHVNTWPIVMGERRRMVQMRTGSHKDVWLDLALARTHYRDGV